MFYFIEKYKIKNSILSKVLIKVAKIFILTDSMHIFSK